MKNISKYIVLFVICLYSCNTNSQIVITRETNSLPENYNTTGQYYYKDINNWLNNFTGIWEYTNGNEKFQVTLTKIVMYHNLNTILNLNYYEDRILLTYRKYINNNLIYESPLNNYPNFTATNSILLEGNIKDHGRITKTIYIPLHPDQIYRQGGLPISLSCKIEKLENIIGQQQKIKFLLYSIDIPNYDYETYAGQPAFSLPNNIVMVKVN